MRLILLEYIDESLTKISTCVEFAVGFHHQTSMRVASTSLFQWQAKYHAHRGAHNQAARFYDDHLCKRFWASWLSQFREGVEERKRQKLVKKLQDRQAARVLYRKSCSLVVC